MYCNTTGVFNNLLYGSYCIKITNDPACYDTTITRCFTVNKPIPTFTSVDITNRACSTFTVIVKDTANWNNGQFCLYDVNHVVIICNSTGVFTNLPYGTYCITATNNPACYDTAITVCFTVKPSVPSVNATVKISSKTCTSFTAEIQDQQNLRNENYCLYNSSNVLLLCNTNGKFTNLLYGSYCIKITNNPACYDTIITRCFTVTPPQTQFTLSAAKSCNIYGTTNITVNISSGMPSYTVKLYDTSGTNINTIITASGSVTFNNLPALPVPQQYKVVVTDQCNKKDSLYVTPVTSSLNKKITVTKKCPSGINPDGAVDIQTDATTNMGTVTPQVIKKNNAPFIVNYNYNSGSLFVFNDLPPATYIIEYSTTGCTTKAYDTVVAPAYIYPDLSKSAGYHCDNNTISVGAAATGGMAPFLYEIFQSIPDSPSIISPPQPNPVFTFNTTTNYSLIRLRGIDACGNASINDVSILPLAPISISPSVNLYCYYDSVTLRVDTIANAVYSWYHILSPTDSVLVSTSASYFIRLLLPADTGTYVCHVSVNNNCLHRNAYYHLVNMCGLVLPVTVVLKGEMNTAGTVNLIWDATNEIQVKSYEVQRSAGTNSLYSVLGQTTRAGNHNSYTWKDIQPMPGNNYYRIKITAAGGEIKYSNSVLIKNTAAAGGITIFPNPVKEVLTVSFGNKAAGQYRICLQNVTGQIMYSTIFYNNQNANAIVPRPSEAGNGVYIITITHVITGQKVNYKVIYQ